MNASLCECLSTDLDKTDQCLRMMPSDRPVEYRRPASSGAVITSTAPSGLRVGRNHQHGCSETHQHPQGSGGYLPTARRLSKDQTRLQRSLSFTDLKTTRDNARVASHRIHHRSCLTSSRTATGLSVTTIAQTTPKGNSRRLPNTPKHASRRATTNVDGSASAQRSNKTLAAPQAKYRPLSLGGESGTGDGLEQRMGSRDLAEARNRGKNRNQHLEESDTGERAPRTQYSPNRSREVGPPVVSSDEYAALLSLDASTRTEEDLHQEPWYRRAGMSSAPDLLESLALETRASDLVQASRPQESVPSLVAAPKARRRPSWMRRYSSRSESKSSSPLQSSGDSNDTPTAESAVISVPLHSECVCKECSGRIMAGLNPGDAPHWSRQARLKWLADRKQTQQLVLQAPGQNSLVSPCKVEALTLTGDLPGLVMRSGTGSQRWNVRSPPPSSSAGSTSLPDDNASLYQEVAQAPQASSLQNTSQEQSVTLNAETEDDREADEDFQSIMRGDSGLSNAHSGPSLAVQVDEVDSKYGNVRHPGGLGLATGDPPSSPPSPVQSPPGEPSSLAVSNPLRQEWNGSPVGVSPDERIALDDELEKDVQRRLDARQHRRRSDQAVARGGARGMMAQLELADEAEQTANAERLRKSYADGARVHADRVEQLRPMGAWSPPPQDPFKPPSRSTSPAIRPPRRTSSPLMDRLKDALSPTLHHGGPRQTQHRRSSSGSVVAQLGSESAPPERHRLDAANGNDLHRNIVRTPSPFIPTSPMIPEEGATSNDVSHHPQLARPHALMRPLSNAAPEFDPDPKADETQPRAATVEDSSARQGRSAESKAAGKSDHGPEQPPHSRPAASSSKTRGNKAPHSKSKSSHNPASASTGASSTVAVEEMDVQQRLKRRSLQRKFSAPLSAAKGFFKH